VSCSKTSQNNSLKLPSSLGKISQLPNVKVHRLVGHSTNVTQTPVPETGTTRGAAGNIGWPRTFCQHIVAVLNQDVVKTYVTPAKS
jgi:hypothetical protein